MSTSCAQLLRKIVPHNYSVCRFNQEVSKNVPSSFSTSSFSPSNQITKNVDRQQRIFSNDPYLNISSSRQTCSCSSYLILKRTFKIYSESFSKTGDDENDEKSKVKANEIESKANEEAYDPKKDSFFTQDTAFGSKENKGLGESDRPVFIPDQENETKITSAEDLTPPTTCCQSGCPNCVWIDYVERLSKLYEDPSLSKERILKELDGIEDSNIKAFIMMELRVKKLI
ncbi:unnamed protein product [Orchesella dallaii]|uniref:Oxidoreductase-like domain-containing protein n=1 Tax=Orchesella dallaii TaxID=48710 RepID=A0ABP1RWX9_9HEXA